MDSDDTFMIPDGLSNANQSDELNLMQVATLLLGVEAMKEKHLTGSLHDTRDISWTILLRLYVADGSGELITISDLVATYAKSPDIITRYVNLLSRIGLVATEQDLARNKTDFLTLTDRANELLPTMLREFHAGLDSSGMF